MRPYRQTTSPGAIVLNEQTHRARDLDALLAHIEELTTPTPVKRTTGSEPEHARAFRRRFVHTLNDLDLSPLCGITVEIANGNVIIKAETHRAAEILLRVLEQHADHHYWRSARW
jgi:hypothetical protein